MLLPGRRVCPSLLCLAEINDPQAKRRDDAKPHHFTGTQMIITSTSFILPSSIPPSQAKPHHYIIHPPSHPPNIILSYRSDRSIAPTLAPAAPIGPTPVILHVAPQMKQRSERHRLLSLLRGGICLFSSSGVMGLSSGARVVSIPENIWRPAAAEHSDRIRNLLAPGLTGIDHPMNSGQRRQLGRDAKNEKPWTALDPQNPVYNFLIEYYGLKGARGPKRLARWSPDSTLLLCNEDELISRGLRSEMKTIAGVESKDATEVSRGILLEGAKEDDLTGTLHLKGAMPLVDGSGFVYSPALFYSRLADDNDRTALMKSASPFLWYRSILANTLSSEPIFHCHGLHEWAMQYHPEGAEPPPSGKYQRHMPLRVSRKVISETVERRGIHCTHVDALRFFAPAAAPLNHHGARLQRTDQLRLEQKGCVHAHMDLLKISTRLQPFVDAALVADTLETALAARSLDIEASPYDVTSFGLGIVPVETSEGREEYRRRQKLLMEKAQPVRKRLLNSYNKFLELAFDTEILTGADRNPAPERFAAAEPGSAPWRKNLIPK